MSDVACPLQSVLQFEAARDVAPVVLGFNYAASNAQPTNSAIPQHPRTLDEPAYHRSAQ